MPEDDWHSYRREVLRRLDQIEDDLKEFRHEISEVAKSIAVSEAQRNAKSGIVAGAVSTFMGVIAILVSWFRH